MQVLMSAAALERIRTRLDEIDPNLDVIAMQTDGSLHRLGERLDAALIDPEVVWLSLDTFRTGQTAHLFGKLLSSVQTRWTQIFAAGLDHPAFKAVMAKGIRLTKSSAQAPAIAEYVLAHALSLLHPIAAQRDAQAAHAWTYIPFREIASTQWLMVGYGAIGQEIARRLKPFNAPLTLVRRNLAAEPLASNVVPMSELLSAVEDSDVVILACALTEQTRGLADGDFFQALKPGCLFINVARGGLVDEAALKTGLEQGRPALAVLDVAETEPVPQTSWLWDHPNVRLTGHCSNAGDGVLARGDTLFLENLRRYRVGAPLLNEASLQEVGL
jgi:phosphoglycerate dehydrogenase-like enzyme